MYMRTYEFRNDMKKYFDSALRGEEVQIERAGVLYSLSVVGAIGAPERLSTGHIVKQVTFGSIDQVKDLFPKTKEMCKIHNLPLTTQGKCLQKGCKNG